MRLDRNNQEIEEARIKAVLSAEEAEKVVDKLIQAGLGDVYDYPVSAFKVINTMMSSYPNIPLLLDFIVSSNQADVPDEYFRIESTFGNISFASYSLRQMHNECFYMNFYFDRNGDIYPCAGLKHEKTGSIDSIGDALRADNLKRFYHMSLGQKAVCSECELRYACNSCESLNYTFLNSYDRNVLCFHDK